MDLDLQGYPPTLSLNFTNKNMKFNQEIAFFLGGSAPQIPTKFATLSDSFTPSRKGCN